jgi:tRNA-2-methylthio-N6-dimethylallyladenosine synthase
MADQVPEDVMAARLARLQALTDQQQKGFNRSSIGRTLDVLFERRGKLPGQVAGRSPWLQAVQVEASAALIGQIAPVEITATGAWSLHGVLADDIKREAVA